MSNADLNKNAFYNIIKTVSSIIFPLITFPYVSRVVQPENIGKVNFGNSIVSYISMIATLGVSTYAVRECSKYKNNRAELGTTAGQILSINLLTTIAAYMLLAVLLIFYGKLRDYRLLISIQSVTVAANTIGADWLNTAMEDFKYITLRTLAMQILSIVLMFVFVRTPDDYMNYALILVLSASGASVLNVLYRRRYCCAKITLHMDLRRHFIPIVSLFAMMLAQQVFTMCDTTIIGLQLGDYEVGLYSTALKVNQLTNQVVTSIFLVVLPQLSVAFTENNVEDCKRLLRYILDFSAVIGIPCLIGMFSLSDEIIYIIGGTSYLGASGCIKILSATLVAGLTSNFMFNANLLACGKDKLCLVICVICAAVNVVTNLIFIPIYGIEAAAVTTFVSQLLISVMAVPFVNKAVLSFNALPSLLQPVIAGAGMLAVIVGVKAMTHNAIWALIGSVLLGGLVYFGLLMIQRNQFVLNIAERLFSKVRTKGQEGKK